MKIGDTVTTTENTKVKFGYSDGMEGTVIDVFDSDAPFRFAVNFPELGNDQFEFFNEDELVKV